MTFSNDSVYFAGFTISPRITSSMDGSVCSVVGSLSLSLSTRSKANAEVGVAIKTVVVSDYATHWLDSSGTEWAKAADGGARFRQVGSKFDWCCEAAKPRDAVALREAAKPGDCRWRCEKHKSRLKAQGQDSASQGRPATSARSVMTMEAGMTPPARSVKRPARSPLHEMDEDTHDDGSIGLSVATIGNIVRSEIERGLAPVEQKLNHIHNILDERIDKIESTVGEQGLRIDKLEQLVMHAEGTPRSHVSERSVQLENHINDLQSQVAALRTSEPSTQQDYMRTMVIGGLDALPSLQEATTWLTTKLSALQGPSHIGTYMKSQMFQGLLFAKFRNSVDRDTAVALLRSAEMQEKGKRVWATQDLPMMQRVQKVFIMGLRWQLGEWGS